jgi:hypothetical protein
MKQKAAQIANPLSSEVVEENMKEPPVEDSEFIAHQQQNI